MKLVLSMIATSFLFACGVAEVSKTKTTTPADLEPERAEYYCRDDKDHGYRMTVFGQNGEIARASLFLITFFTTENIAEMNVCQTVHDSDVKAICNNVNWEDRYDMTLIDKGDGRFQADVFHNEKLLEPLECRKAPLDL